jgi:DNA mismatch repair protein MutS
MSKYPEDFSHLPEHLLTNSAKQYLEAKIKYPDIILFWRTGDFYETFGNDALLFSRECEVVLTRKSFTRDTANNFSTKPTKPTKTTANGFNWDNLDSEEEAAADEAEEAGTAATAAPKVPMSGVPHHAIDRYLTRLVERGFKVAVAEQIGEPGLTKGPMERQVLRVITPGTVVEPAMLDAKRNNYLAALWLDSNTRGAGLAYADVTTGEFFCTVFNESSPDELKLLVRQELSRLGPAEVIIPKKPEPRRFKPETLYNEDDPFQEYRELVAPYGPTFPSPTLTPTEFYTWHEETAKRNLLDHFGLASLESFGCAHLPAAIRAAGAILEYLKEAQRGTVARLNPLVTYTTKGYMLLDVQTRRNLELLEGGRNSSKRYTLFGVLDKTRTAMGGRLLHKWLNQPLIDVGRLQKRQKAVQVLYNSTALRDQLREVLSKVQDLERLTNRICMGNAQPRELEGLRNSLELIPEVRLMLEGAPENVRQVLASLLRNLHPCEDAYALLLRALAPSAELPAVLGHGSVFSGGFDTEFDQVREASHSEGDWIRQKEAAERERTGIKNLKIDHNNVSGFYIEVTKANINQVPKDYIRKQTLTNAERFITAELKEKEVLIDKARERLKDLEAILYKKLLKDVADASELLLKTAAALAHLDVFAALAEVAVQNNYICPELNNGPVIKIVGGRHPVVETANPEIVFVPNDLYLHTEQEQILIITGPNMAGKSTIMRQAALIVLMAQIGSFVPAESAQLGIVDRVFTRVGAQDDIATGQSTFMVEMVETSYILAHATPRSLIILDEVGRGTSTYDGMAIAQAIVEYIHNNPQCGAKTLFATHYHELTSLSDTLPRLRNYNVAVNEDNGTVNFLRKLVPGGADRSYGVHVAQLAGLPKSVIHRAEELLELLEASNQKQKSRAALANPPKNKSGNNHNHNGQSHSSADSPLAPINSSSANSYLQNPLMDEIRALRVMEFSPLEAINKLYELQQKLKELEAATTTPATPQVVREASMLDEYEPEL